jgi:hypothetical protein
MPDCARMGRIRHREQGRSNGAKPLSVTITGVSSDQLRLVFVRCGTG